MTFNEKVTQGRKNKGWTQSQMGDLIGASRDLVGKYERGDINPPLEVAARIAEVLDYSLDYLVGLTAENLEKPQDAIPGRLKPILTKFEQLSPADRTLIVTVMDALIMKAKIQSMQE
jgi:transcriptional regulator with XRE-family HTH domain